MSDKYVWKDIVKIDDAIYAEEFEISGEQDDPYTYQIDDFIKAVADKYGVDTDRVKTYMMDNIPFDSSVLPFGAEECGCYINGVPEWMLE